MSDERIYDPDEDKNYYSGLLKRLQHDVKTIACLALVDKEGPPVTHVNGVRIDDALEMSKRYAGAK